MATFDMSDHMKGIVITAVWFTGFVGVLVPLRLRSHGLENEQFMSLMTCFAAGVILSVAMCHLLPDSTEAFSKTMEYPLANALAGIGLLTVLLVERAFADPHEAIIGHLRGSPGRPRKGGRASPTVASYEHVVEETRLLPHRCEDELSDDHIDDDTVCDLSQHHHHVKYQSKIFRKGMESGVKLTKHMVSDKDHGCTMESHSPSHGIQITYDEKPIGVWVSLTIFAVLSFHSVIEGLALGSAISNKSIVMLAVAILGHKFLAAMSLGISFLKSGVDRRTFMTYALMFSCATPFGALLGVILSDIMAIEDVKFFSAVCQSIGSGTFLYISLMELIPEEMHGGQIFRKWTSLAMGFVLMALIALWV